MIPDSLPEGEDVGDEQEEEEEPITQANRYTISGQKLLFVYQVIDYYKL